MVTTSCSVVRWGTARSRDRIRIWTPGSMLVKTAPASRCRDCVRNLNTIISPSTNHRSVPTPMRFKKRAVVPRNTLSSIWRRTSWPSCRSSHRACLRYSLLGKRVAYTYSGRGPCIYEVCVALPTSRSWSAPSPLSSKQHAVLTRISFIITAQFEITLHTNAISTGNRRCFCSVRPPHPGGVRVRLLPSGWGERVVDFICVRHFSTRYLMPIVKSMGA